MLVFVFFTYIIFTSPCLLGTSLYPFSGIGLSLKYNIECIQDLFFPLLCIFRRDGYWRMGTMPFMHFLFLFSLSLYCMYSSSIVNILLARSHAWVLVLMIFLTLFNFYGWDGKESHCRYRRKHMYNYATDGFLVYPLSQNPGHSVGTFSTMNLIRAALNSSCDT